MCFIVAVTSCGQADIDLARIGQRGHLHGRVRFEGLEGEEPWLLSRVETVRDTYLGRLRAQHEGLDAIARAVGWTFTCHHTDRPPQTALLALYTALSQTLEG